MHYILVDFVNLSKNKNQCNKNQLTTGCSVNWVSIKNCFTCSLSVTIYKKLKKRITKGKKFNLCYLYF